MNYQNEISEAIIYLHMNGYSKEADVFREFMSLAVRVSNLNPNAGEIGEGMLRTLVKQAGDALHKFEDAK